MKAKDVEARRRARRRAAALAARLRGSIEQLLDGADAEHGEPPTAQHLRVTLDALDRALRYGLEFGFTPDPELGRRRGHVRNVLLLVRQDLETTGALPRPDRLRRAGRRAEELIGTVRWIDGRVLAVEAAGPGPAWPGSWSARVLGLASWLLPTHHRGAFIEEQCGNLAFAGSRREWVHYLLGVLWQMPAIASAARAAEEPAAGPWARPER